MIPRRVLIVGAGVLGHRHYAAILAAGDQVTAVVDPLISRAEILAPGAQSFIALEDAMKQNDLFDVAVIASPSRDHFLQIQLLAMNGYAVLVEKPHRIPGQNFSKGKWGLEYLEKVFVGMSTRHWPGVIELGSAISSGELGKILSYSDRVSFTLEEGSLPPWYFSREISGGGILLTNGVHAIDRARTLLKSDLVLTSAQLTKMYASHECEDSAEIRFTTKGNVAVDISLSWLPYEPIGTGITVVGTQGSAQIAMNGVWNITTIKETRSGGAIDIDVLPFQKQWSAFLAEMPGFRLSDLEPTLNQIESIYHENSIDTTSTPA